MLDDIFPPRPVSSREDLIRSIRKSLGGAVEREIDTHNTQSIIFVFGYRGSKLLLKAEFGSQTATHREITWYEALSTRDSGIVPKSLASRTSDSHALLLLEFIEESMTLDELAHDSARSDGVAVTEGIALALASDQRLFATTSRYASSQEVSHFFERKYEARRREAHSIPYLRRLLELPQVTVNGQALVAPDKALAKIQNSQALRQYLTPNRVGLTHGDLHCGNVLLKGKDVFFIDPNGQLDMPLEYDVGKMLHSIHGNYGSIMLGKYKLSIEDSSRYSFSIDRPEPYDAALNTLRRRMTDQQYARGLYAEAMHFAMMLPHHARNQKETLALYLRCVQLFNELLILAA